MWRRVYYTATHEAFDAFTDRAHTTDSLNVKHRSLMWIAGDCRQQVEVSAGPYSDRNNTDPGLADGRWLGQHTANVRGSTHAEYHRQAGHAWITSASAVACREDTGADQSQSGRKVRHVTAVWEPV